MIVTRRSNNMMPVFKDIIWCYLAQSFLLLWENCRDQTFKAVLYRPISKREGHRCEWQKTEDWCFHQSWSLGLWKGFERLLHGTHALLIVLLLLLFSVCTVNVVLSFVFIQCFILPCDRFNVKCCSVQMWTGYLLQEGSKKNGLSPESSHLYQILLFYWTQDQ